MIKTIIYSFKRVRRYRKISKVLGHIATLNPSEYTEYLIKRGRKKRIKDREKKEKALEDLLVFCETDPQIVAVMEKYNVNRETLKTVYEKLILAGAGQWAKGFYVPVSSLVYPSALDYLLKNMNKDEEDFKYVAWRLLRYFKNMEIGEIKD